LLGENGLELVQYICDQIEYYRNGVGFPQDSELQNIVDELLDLADSTKYKLRFLK
jgi:hypothetical protein